ncbi:Membrane protein involved in the export of O-antigen and teichoic acid [Aliiruegeria lutimaris]|uniref:Membrane protein involved in the export of O-antigen and teichoic acid n=1 Tax=Aliiruegeria lutimaris TaxID=571298 RepID=A0A1G9DV51_9RHOB|nr:Membrane protein involved in the export of O-antigen and teichoic acid [Aliiruegeria lutimaris]
MRRFLNRFSGESVAARTLRGSLWTALAFGGENLLRLVSNLVLTRLLFPEAFGLMAIAQVFLTAMQMLSDAGLRPAVIKDSRGDDPAFLNTAWTVQILRANLLWLLVFLLASPAAAIYGEPILAQLLPWMGFTIILQGLTPTAVWTAERHLHLGRLTIIQLGVAAFHIVVACLLAWQMQSVWALVFAALVSSACKQAAYWKFVPNASNRLFWEREALQSLFHFGKFVFVSSIAGFLVGQGDRALLGLYTSMAELGVYNIGYFMAMAPSLLAVAVQKSVIFPLYRLKPISTDPDSREKVFRARRLLATTMIVFSLTLSATGPWLVRFLYDDRYVSAGPMMALFGLTIVPLLTLRTTGQMLLAMGDSKRFLNTVLVAAIFQTFLLFVGVRELGVVGAILAPGVACVISYPLHMQYAKIYKGWDPVHDVGLTILGMLGALGICIWHAETISTLFP